MFRIGIGSFSHETHTFLADLTTKREFEAAGVAWGGDVIERNRNVRNYIRGYIDVLAAVSAEMIGTVHASFGHWGWVTAEAFEKYTGGIVDGLQNAGKLDGVLLALHGAMATRDILKPEAEIVRRVRAVVGDIPIMVTLDLHANEDHELTDVADAVFVCQKYPHTDTYETGLAAAKCMIATLKGEFKPAMAIHKPGIISPSVFQWTEASPMKDLRDRADEWQAREKAIEYISIAPGYGYADVPDVGASVIVVTNGDKALAETVARDIAAHMWQLREDLARKPILNAAQAADKTVQLLQQGVRPVVLADGSDRTGDSTHVMRELLQRGVKNAALSTINDAAAVQECERAGLGATVTLSVGGRGQASGAPLEVTGKIEFLGNGDYIHTGPMNNGGKALCGPSAVLNIGDGNRLVISSFKHQVFDDAGFRAFGIDLDALDVMVIRSRVHFRAYYESVAGASIEVDAPGMGPADLTFFDYQNIPADVFPVGRNWRR